MLVDPRPGVLGAALTQKSLGLVEVLLAGDWPADAALVLQEREFRIDGLVDCEVVDPAALLLLGGLRSLGFPLGLGFLLGGDGGSAGFCGCCFTLCCCFPLTGEGIGTLLVRRAIGLNALEGGGLNAGGLFRGLQLPEGIVFSGLDGLLVRLLGAGDAGLAVPRSVLVNHVLVGEFSGEPLLAGFAFQP